MSLRLENTTSNSCRAALHARCEFEEVARKPLGDGFLSVLGREFRGAGIGDWRMRSELARIAITKSLDLGRCVEVRNLLTTLKVPIRQAISRARF
jgi:hypothetical protein